MNQNQLQTLARERVLDAQALLDGGRWGFAYYNVGYAVECALKACFLARMPLTGWVFQDKVKIDECRTHDFAKLIQLAGLQSELLREQRSSSAAGQSFAQNWNLVITWTVESRYSTTITEQDARNLYASITDQPDGVLPWIQMYW